MNVLSNLQVPVCLLAYELFHSMATSRMTSRTPSCSLCGIAHTPNGSHSYCRVDKRYCVLCQPCLLALETADDFVCFPGKSEGRLDTAALDPALNVAPSIVASEPAAAD